MSNHGRRSDEDLGLGSARTAANQQNDTHEHTDEYRAGYADGYQQGDRDRAAAKTPCASCSVFREIEDQYPVRFSSTSTATGEEIVQGAWDSWREVEMRVRATHQIAQQQTEQTRGQVA